MSTAPLSRVTPAMNNPAETWKDAPNWEGYYSVSSLGRVKSKDRRCRAWGCHTRSLKGRILKIATLPHGYCVAYLCRGSEHKEVCASVHRLVALAFIPNPENKAQVNHKNGIKSDNRVENLEWATMSENIRHAYANLGHKPGVAKGEAHYRCKITESQVRQIRLLSGQGITNVELAKVFGLSQANIGYIVNNITWKHLAE